MRFLLTAAGVYKYGTIWQVSDWMVGPGEGRGFE